MHTVQVDAVLPSHMYNAGISLALAATHQLQEGYISHHSFPVSQHCLAGATQFYRLSSEHNCLRVYHGLLLRAGMEPTLWFNVEYNKLP